MGGGCHPAQPVPNMETEMSHVYCWANCLETPPNFMNFCYLNLPNRLCLSQWMERAAKHTYNIESHKHSTSKKEASVTVFTLFFYLLADHIETLTGSKIFVDF